MQGRTYIRDLKQHVGKEVTVAGWISGRRDHGKLIFLDLRDETGLVQTVAKPTHAEAHGTADTLRQEWVVKGQAMVNKRPEKMVNAEQENGDIELEFIALEVLNEAETPLFDLSTPGYEVSEEIRLKYRYLDLRRARLQKNMRMRDKVIKYMRNFLSERGFVEIETPILTKSTPEGARDYVVPARLEWGKFYALPQSPQQYKQLLMASGFERYFQVARVFRDEDMRGDRQAEFTQLDIELAFPTQEEILNLTETLYTLIVQELYPKKRIQEVPWPRMSYDEAMKKYGTDRPDIRENKEDPDLLAFVWVLDFPLFEAGMEHGHYAPSHHMFTAPKEEDIEKLDTDPGSVRSYQHDMVLNGYEVGGGSIRIHRSDLQQKIFKLIGFDERQQKEFAHMLEAFRKGVPPHGGIAPGIDRLLMVLENEPNIREVIAFPKTGEGRDLMMSAPSEISQKQLDELGLKVQKKKSQP
ncbi:MAG: aspartate--tRNA ligase [Parcubacteria group bacterium]|nr:aspartate--tRNA ligase [Parcubacteria group bacterium]